MRLSVLVLACGLAGLRSAAPALADPAFSLSPAVQSTVGSNEVAFTGTLVNTNQTDALFLNDIAFSLVDEATNYLAGESNAFFANVPGILLAGETYSDVVFAVAIDPATPPGQYGGVVTLQGGTNIVAATNVANATFEVVLPPATLGIALSDGNPILAWPSPPGGFVLQNNADVASTNWVTVTNAPTVANGQNRLILPPSGGREFYRLRYP